MHNSSFYLFVCLGGALIYNPFIKQQLVEICSILICLSASLRNKIKASMSIQHNRSIIQ